MVYILFGTEIVVIKNKINEIKKEAKLDNLAWNYYDLESSSLKNIIDDANSGTLFSPKRGIVVDNAYIFTATTNKKLPEQDPKILESYLDNINPDTILIFSVNSEKLDVRKKITKKIKEVGKVIDCNIKKNSIDVIKSMFLPCSINYDEAMYFKNKVGNDYGILVSEAKKIVTYKGDTSKVTKEDIDLLTEIP